MLVRGSRQQMTMLRWRHPIAARSPLRHSLADVQAFVRRASFLALATFASTICHHDDIAAKASQTTMAAKKVLDALLGHLLRNRQTSTNGECQ